jgi:hypothetical protein
MSHHPSNPEHLFLSRRELLRRTGMGMGMLALGGLFGEKGIFGPAGAQAAVEEISSTNPLAVRKPWHFEPKAKRVIHIFLNGGASHVDTFDPKPELDKWHGKEIPNKLPTERKTGAAYKSPFKFQKYGKCGMDVSELFAKTAQHVDDMCFVRSMRADVPNHEPSLLLMNCGDSRLPRPSMGSWITYGLGTENQNLPGFVSLCPGYPIQESQNWQSGFLPGIFQGTYIDTRKQKIEDLIENIRNDRITNAEQAQQLDLLRKLNAAHLEHRQKDAQIEARVQSFELAFRMQMEAADAFDVTREPQSIRDLYGPGTQARQFLIARRLLEKGVRFVQLWHGDGQPWDNHDDIEVQHRRLAGECDQGIAALLTDLKQRGMLKDTLVICSGEFGRTPTVELPTPGSNAGKVNGRDHNHHGFTLWMAGGGVKGGSVYGATDEFGFKATENPVHIHDLHATILKLMGFDHEKFTYRYAGRDFRLTDVHGHVVDGLIA